MSDDPPNINNPPTMTFDTIAEVIGLMYTGQVLQFYFGESGGKTNYADHDIEQKIFIEGKVLWGEKQVVAVECEIVTPAKTYTKEVLINGWGIRAVMPKGKDNIQISHIIHGTRR